MKNKVLAIFPANSLQRGFIYHALSHPEDDAYVVQMLVDYHKDLSIDLYVKAWTYCIEQYPILRTAFNWEEDIIQIIYERGKLEFYMHDISHLHDQHERERAISLIQQNDRLHKFDLQKPQLFRLHIIKQTSDMYTVLKTEHHIISDGWSEAVLLKSVHGHYENLINDREIILEVDTAYLRTQEYISNHGERARLSWTHLDEVIGPNNIASLFSKPIDLFNHRQVEVSSHCTIRIEGDNYKALKEFSALHGITLNVLVQFGWHKIIQLYSNDQQTIVGTTISGRDLPIDDIEHSVGLYINTLPLVIDWSKDISVLDQLDYIQQKIAHINSDGFVDLARLQKNGARLFHSLFVFENYPSMGKSDGAHDIIVRGAIEKTNYPLSITVQENQRSLFIDLEYDTEYLHADKAIALLASVKDIVLQAVNRPNVKHYKLDLLNEVESQLILREWNNTNATRTAFTRIYELFEQRVKDSPDHTALFFEENRLSYRELNEMSNQLARQIRHEFQERTQRSFMPDTIIALCLTRSIEMIVGILAIWKAGGAYVPIDINFPEQRIRYIQKDTNAQLILCKRETRAAIPVDLHDKILLIDAGEDFYKLFDRTDLTSSSDPGDVAYVLYTSGTTGVPKGVMVPHRGILNLINELLVKYRIEPLEHFLLLANYVFDMSIEQMLLSLSSGGTLFIVTNDTIADGNLFMDYVAQNKITYLDATPSFIGSLDPTRFSTLKRLAIGGEALPEALLKQFSGHVPFIINGYGPTEASVTPISGFDSTLIGKPIKNTRVYILDLHMNPVPVGVMGELYIGGICLARGYLNRVELTHDRFVDNPFATAEDKANGYTRLYRTGDLVKWVADGNIEYIGRNDEQVKIRGYRIELDEVEHVLGKQAGVQQCCVLVKERNTPSGKTKYLVGYYVKSDSRAEITATGLLQLLGQSLPEYMVPSVLVELESFPLTINGKLDKQALPDPEHSLLEEYVTPVSEVEKKLCGIWQEVLGLERVGITDNFFRIGGDSILSIQLTSRIRQSGLPCQVKDIFECKTIGRLADQINKRTETVSIQSEQGLLAGYCDLLPIQSWFFDQIEKGSFLNYNHWNQSFLIKTPALELSRLQQISVDLANHHDVLRMRYLREQTPEGVRWKQVYQSTGVVPEIKVLCVQGLSASAIESTLTDWQSGFNLDQGPLFQLGYLYGYEDESCRIFFASHHLIVDGVSWRILNEDIRTLYSGKLLSSKGSSYRQWANTLAGYARHHRDEAAYWQRQLQDIPRYEVPERPGESWEEVSFELSSELTDTLLYQAPNSYHTEINDLLLTALAYALKDHNGSDLQGIMLEAHGRENIDSSIDITRTVGWFTSLFPVRLELQQDVGESIQFIKESLRHIPNKGIGFGVFDGNTSSKFSTENLPPITFNYLGQLDAQDGDWKIVGESSGLNFHSANRSQNVIDINGMVIENRMVFGIATRLGRKRTEALCDNLKSHLVEVVEQCLHQLANAGSRFTPNDFEDFNPYEIVNEDQEGDPIFFLPPGGAGIGTYFTSIIPVLKHKKLVALNDYYTFIRDTKKIDVSGYRIEALGKYTRLLIRRLQPFGGYTLIGFSWGGVLAFEVCRQLVQEGCTIRNLFILDSHFGYKALEQHVPDKAGYRQEFRNNIHYEYYPKVNLKNLKVTLFKALRSFWNEMPLNQTNVYQMVDRAVEPHFLKSKFNGLEHLARPDSDVGNSLDVVEIDCNHGEILKIQKAVQVVCDCLVKKIN